MSLNLSSIPKSLAIQAAAALILAIIAFFIFGHWATSLVDRNELLDVVVSARDLKAPINLVAEDLKIVRMKRELIPATALVQTKDALGVTLLHPLSAGQVITTNELAGKRDLNSGGFGIPVDRQGFMLPINWLAGSFPKLVAGDTVTLLAANQSILPQDRVTITLAEHVPVREIIAGTDGVIQRVLLIIDLQTASNILQVRAANALIEVLVDGTDPLPKK